MRERRVSARSIDADGGVARHKDAHIALDTDVAGRPDAFNPAELPLAALAVCMIKGIERVTPILTFHPRGAEVRLHAEPQDRDPRPMSGTIPANPGLPGRRASAAI